MSPRRRARLRCDKNVKFQGDSEFRVMNRDKKEQSNSLCSRPALLGQEAAFLGVAGDRCARVSRGVRPRAETDFT